MTPLREPPKIDAPAPRRPRAVLALLLTGLVFLIVGARWDLIAQFGTDVPEWDEWDAEGLYLLVPWHAGELTWSVLAHPQNEHRVILTKLWVLGLTVLNGQWDQRLLAVANALLPAFIGVGLLWYLRRSLRGWPLVAVAAVMAAGAALPVAWHNTLSGFHSQQFFLIGCSAVAILALGCAPFSAGKFVAGAVAASLALGAMGSGALAAAAIMPLLVLQVWHRQVRASVASIIGGYCAALFLAGLWTRVEVDVHEYLKAQSAGDFFFTLINALRWPAQGSGWFALLLWAPLTVLGVWLISRPRGSVSDSVVYGLVGLGLWVVLQQIAAAYARGAGAPNPSSRYLDTLLIGSVANIAAVGWLVQHAHLRPIARRAVGVLGVGWLSVFGHGLVSEAAVVRRDPLPDVAAEHRRIEATVRAYLETGDEAELREPDLPYPGRAAFLERINQAALRALMPASVRPALAAPPSHTRGPFFRVGDLRPANALGETPLPPPRPLISSMGQTESGEWRSRPISPPRSRHVVIYLQAVDAGPDAKLNLQLVETRPKGVSITVPLPRSEAAAPVPVVVQTPPGVFEIVARDFDPVASLAFSEPVEIGRGSVMAWRATRAGRTLALVGAAGLVIALILELWFSRSRNGMSGPALTPATVAQPRVSSLGATRRA